MFTKSHIHKRCGTSRNKSFSTRGYAKIHIPRGTLLGRIMQPHENKYRVSFILAK
jgi:hypothetical protein